MFQCVTSSYEGLDQLGQLARGWCFEANPEHVWSSVRWWKCTGCVGYPYEFPGASSEHGVGKIRYTKKLRPIQTLYPVPPAIPVNWAENRGEEI